jgi:hypothetical protein
MGINYTKLSSECLQNLSFTSNCLLAVIFIDFLKNLYKLFRLAFLKEALISYVFNVLILLSGMYSNTRASQQIEYTRRVCVVVVPDANVYFT